MACSFWETACQPNSGLFRPHLLPWMVYIYSIWPLNRGQYPYKWLWDYAGDIFLKP